MVTSRPIHGLPAMEAGDVYVYAFANGAIFVRYHDGRSLLAPLAEVEVVARGCHDAGHRVVVAWEAAPIAVDVVARIRDAGVPVVEFPDGLPPHTWGEGTNPLMEAAALGTDAILDDLVARGVDLHLRDDSGSTALHHAAANGQLDAVDALVAAGADPLAANHEGFTPHDLAVACRRPQVAERLVDLGADPPFRPSGDLVRPGSPRSSGGDRRGRGDRRGGRRGAADGTDPVLGSDLADGSGVLRFRRVHAGTFYVWLVPAVFFVVLVAVLWPSPFLLLVVAVYALAIRFVVPPRAFWAGGAPLRLDGSRLTIRGVLGATRVVDLPQVTLAGAGGSASRSSVLGARWLILAHPDGHPITRRTLARLLVPEAEIDAWMARIEDPAASRSDRVDRVIVVPLDGARRDEVIVPVGNVLSANGVDLSASLRSQLTRARRTPGPGRD